jgi:UDP-3-O-[3-hydroxymyristoyl] N-acetylglucosamine deacetylase
VDQSSVKNETIVSGIGLHSGKKATLKFKPAHENTGIVFVRTDLPGKPRITANLKNISGTDRGTNLGDVQTVEHVLSALYAHSISNIEVELDASEPPATDGSAKIFYEALKSAGKIRQKGERRSIKIASPIVLREGDKCLMAIPGDRFTVSFMINYPVSFIGDQYKRFEFGRDDYAKEIAPARTYGFMSELKALKEQGLALGASEENAVAIGDTSYLTPLRFHDELVRHKILDLIGDFSLLQCEIHAHVISIRGGHAMNIKMARIFKEVGIYY